MELVALLVTSVGVLWSIGWAIYSRYLPSKVGRETKSMLAPREEINKWLFEHEKKKIDNAIKASGTAVLILIILGIPTYYFLKLVFPLIQKDDQTLALDPRLLLLLIVTPGVIIVFLSIQLGKFLERFGIKVSLFEIRENKKLARLASDLSIGDFRDLSSYCKRELIDDLQPIQRFEIDTEEKAASKVEDDKSVFLYQLRNGGVIRIKGADLGQLVANLDIESTRMNPLEILFDLDTEWRAPIIDNDNMYFCVLPYEKALERYQEIKLKLHWHIVFNKPNLGI